MSKSIFVITNEDSAVEGVADSLETAKYFCQEYADCCDATAGTPEWREAAFLEIRGHWRVSCYPKDASTEGMGFDLLIDEKEFYSKGDKFPVDLPAGEIEIPAFLRQAE